MKDSHKILLDKFNKFIEFISNIEQEELAQLIEDTDYSIDIDNLGEKDRN